MRHSATSPFVSLRLISGGAILYDFTGWQSDGMKLISYTSPLCAKSHILLLCYLRILANELPYEAITAWRNTTLWVGASAGDGEKRRVLVRSSADHRGIY